ncbi:MAG: hypothetical protein LM582_00665 [Desulfurococcaceae archaeon]|jgi:hypothetical protein|nr:hypothetical protein [Desulfurococcaceae archaeon]
MMYSITVEKRYVVKKGDKSIIVELCRTSDGKLFIVPILTTRHVYEIAEGEQKEWNYDVSKSEEIDYMSLPQNIREALSRLQIL